MRDMDIRQALFRMLWAHHEGEPDAFILEELGLCQGSAIVDVAAVNGDIHGFEIKSENDTLQRLPAQQEVYSKTLERMTIVTTKKHIDGVREKVPHWWGILQAEKKNSMINLKEVRPPKANPGIHPYSLAQLLWRDEALEILDNMGLSKGLRSKPRALLWEKLVECLPLDRLAKLIRLYLRTRKNWRAAPQQT